MWKNHLSHILEQTSDYGEFSQFSIFLVILDCNITFLESFLFTLPIYIMMHYNYRAQWFQALSMLGSDLCIVFSKWNSCCNALSMMFLYQFKNIHPQPKFM
jgi:hypothetical protein